MNQGLIILIIAPLLIAALWMVSRRRKQDSSQRTASTSHLAEMVRSAEVANNGFFR